MVIRIRDAHWQTGVEPTKPADMDRGPRRLSDRIVGRAIGVEVRSRETIPEPDDIYIIPRCDLEKNYSHHFVVLPVKII